MFVKFDPHGDERSPWVTTTKHRFANGLFTMEVPRGFRCDLASVPGMLLWIFGPNERHQRAALFHDAGYRFQPVPNRSAIDELFRTMMVADGVPYWKAWLMWAAVRCFGARRWKENRCGSSAA